VSYLPLFSHIYIEERASHYPLTERIISRFPKAMQVSINNYKEVFNRPRQRWDHQKHALKLILAVRNEAFLYPGSSFVPHFEHSRFFYTTPVLNCLYGCEYCYLQGMFPTANIVAFVNDADFIEAAATELAGPAPAYLCISYDTDLLALENIFGYCERYIEYARSNPHVTLEIRTKSANIEALSGLPPASNVILAWTISPDYVITQYEHRTPSLKARLAAITKAHQHGWRVRLCIDPMIRVDSWQTHYRELVRETFLHLSNDAIEDISIGVFRIPSGYLRAMQENNPTSAIVHYPYTVRNKSASYTPEQHQEMTATIAEQLRPHVPQEKICPVPWQL
jgi:spore photoproduct lyase